MAGNQGNGALGDRALPRNHRQTGSLRGRAGSPSTPQRSRAGHIANCWLRTRRAERCEFGASRSQRSAPAIRNMAGDQGNGALGVYPEITAKRGVYEVGRALRARRSEAGPAILQLLTRVPAMVPAIRNMAGSQGNGALGDRALPRNHSQTGSLRGRAGSPSTPLRSRAGHIANQQFSIWRGARETARSEIAPYPEITAKRGVYEVGRALRARRCEAGSAILRIAGC